MKQTVHQRRRSQRGFTLVELMVGLVIISIISVVFLWASGALSRTYRLRDAINQTVGAIQYARMQSAVRNQNYRVQICPYNKNCNITDHPDLTPFLAQRPAIAGFWFVEQCPNSILSPPTICGDLGQRHELQYYNLARMYRDIQINDLLVNSTRVDSIMLYFRPDGQILSCNKTASVLNCTRGIYNICLRSATDVSGNSPDSIPRRIEINFTGRIQTVADTANLCKR